LTNTITFLHTLTYRTRRKPAGRNDTRTIRIQEAVLFTYGVIPTLQAEPAFGRVYAAYGGIFIVLSIL
jgi:drug/metabolite transporter superfamily protein YnfA